jgi:hypothetical protein
VFAYFHFAHVPMAGVVLYQRSLSTTAADGLVPFDDTQAYGGVVTVCEIDLWRLGGAVLGNSIRTCRVSLLVAVSLSLLILGF